jgi:hypothetical protein
MKIVKRIALILLLINITESLQPTDFSCASSKVKVNFIEVQVNNKELGKLVIPKENNAVNLRLDIQEGSVKVINSRLPNESSNSSNTGSGVNILGKLIPVALISALISALVTYSIYFLNRRQAKNQIKFDLALKSLLPDVYTPLLNELRKNRLQDLEIDTFKIKTVILDNMVLLEFSPKKSREIIAEIYLLTDQIKSSTNYQEKENDLVKLLNDLETEIIKRFEALKG